MLREDVDRLLFYRASQDGMLEEITKAEERYAEEGENSSSELSVLSAINNLVSWGLDRGMRGNLWQNYLVYFVLTDENAYSLAREGSECKEDSFTRLASGDFKIIRKLMGYDFAIFRNGNLAAVVDEVLDFKSDVEQSRYVGAAGKMVATVIEKLNNAETDQDFQSIIDHQYATRGTGDFAFNDAFRISGDASPVFVPIRATDRVTFDGIIGYEDQKAEIRRNTEAFIEGKPANNVLLYGDSGSGKSTSIKAMLNEYAARGLRIIEIHKHQFKHITDVLGIVKRRNYKFILYIDDLSFEEFEIEYKYLKAVIEGDLEIRPDNVLIYATSNRRHLIKETWADKDDMTHSGDIHRSDTVEEKTSLAARFGVSIYYPSPDRMEFHEIVETLAAEAGITMDREEMLVKADAWEIRHGGVSGRTARQFVDYLASGKGTK